VIILLTWFYITGLMLLVGAEINSEIEAAAAEMRLSVQAPLVLGAETGMMGL
jgi:membrane protein